jgi:hypothetical protein
VEPNQINILAFTVLRDLEQIDYTKETRLARQYWRDIQKADRLDRIHLNFTFFHWIADACFNVGACPESYATGDFSATHPFAKTLGEHHEESLLLAAAQLARNLDAPTNGITGNLKLLADRNDVAQHATVLDRGHPRNVSIRWNGLNHDRAQGDSRPRSQAQQITDSCVRADPAVITYVGIPVDRGVVPDETALPHLNVMRHECAVSDPGVLTHGGHLPEYGSGDHGVCENFHVILQRHAAAMGHLQYAAGVPQGLEAF